MFENVVGGTLAAGHAGGDAHTVIGGAGQGQAGPVAQGGAGAGHPVEVTGRVLRQAAAAEVAALDYASVALVALALPPDTPLPDLSGFLVPPAEGTLVKAATFVTHKWAHLSRPGGPVIIRASLGRAGEQERLQPADPVLVATAHAELGRLLGGELPPPVESWVQRWGGGLPQYAPGHLDRVALARAALGDRTGLTLAGAAYDGVGIPACVASGESAADDVLKYLEEAQR